MDVHNVKCISIIQVCFLLKLLSYLILTFLPKPNSLTNRGAFSRPERLDMLMRGIRCTKHHSVGYKWQNYVITINPVNEKLSNGLSFKHTFDPTHIARLQIAKHNDISILHQTRQIKRLSSSHLYQSSCL